MAPRNISVWLIIVAVAVLTFPSPGIAEEYEYGMFMRAKNAFDAGAYEEATSRFNELLKSGIKNPATLLECHKFMGVSYMFLADKDQAEQHFAELLIIAPEYVLDPMLFPMEVIDFFTGVKENNRKRLRALAQARATAEAKRKAAEEVQRLAEIEKLKRNIYIEKTQKNNSLLVALMPFGAGQFQNGHTAKGALFLAGELLLSGAAISTYFLHERLRDRANRPFQSTSKREETERIETAIRITNQASAVSLGVLMVAGIIDSMYGYKKMETRWRQVDETEIPEHIKSPKRKTKLKASVAPTLGTGMVGLEIVGRF